MWAGSRHSSQELAPRSLLSPNGGSGSSAPSTSRRLKTGLTALLLILVLSGCAASTARPIPPTRPTLESLTVQIDGGICMDKQDSTELLLYIDQLEEVSK